MILTEITFITWEFPQNSLFTDSWYCLLASYFLLQIWEYKANYRLWRERVCVYQHANITLHLNGDFFSMETVPFIAGYEMVEKQIKNKIKNCEHTKTCSRFFWYMYSILATWDYNVPDNELFIRKHCSDITVFTHSHTYITITMLFLYY